MSAEYSISFSKAQMFQVLLVLLEDVSNVYGDMESNHNQHIHRKRKHAERREKAMSPDNEDCSAKRRNCHIIVNKVELSEVAGSRVSGARIKGV